MSLKLCAPNINSRSTSGVQRVAKTSDAFAMGQNSPYPRFMAGNSNTFGQQEPVQILDLSPSGIRQTMRSFRARTPPAERQLVEGSMGECSHAGLSRREALVAIGGAAISAVAISDASNARSRDGNK